MAQYYNVSYKINLGNHEKDFYFFILNGLIEVLQDLVFKILRTKL